MNVVHCGVDFVCSDGGDRVIEFQIWNFKLKVDKRDHMGFIYRNCHQSHQNESVQKWK